MSALWMIIFVLHPIIVTIIFVIIFVYLNKKYYIWQNYAHYILIALVLFFIVFIYDSWHALMRGTYATALSEHPKIGKKIPLPRKVVIVGSLGESEKIWPKKLVSGILNEVILVRASKKAKSEPIAFQISIGFSAPGGCPKDRMRFIHSSLRKQFSVKGICPKIRETKMPKEGIFIVSETLRIPASKSAKYFQPKFLVDRPPGPIISYRGIEIQKRQSEKISVLSSSASYIAPGFLAPILIGCWERPDNILWVLPAGDTGCGFWRLFVSGGAAKHRPKEWIFSQAFSPSKTRVQKPSSERIIETTSLQAVKILENLNYDVDDIASFLPQLREQLLDSNLPDKVIIDLILKRATQKTGKLEGALIAFLMEYRPAAALQLPKLIKKIPLYIVRPERIISIMETNPQFRKYFSSLMLESLSGIWTPHNPSIQDKLIKLLSEKETDFLCQNLYRVTKKDGIFERHSKMTNGIRIPVFLPTLIKKAVNDCNDKGVEFIAKIFRHTRGVNRERIIRMVENLDGKVLKQLKDQVVESLIDPIPMDKYPYKKLSRRQIYANDHVRLLRKAGLECNDILDNLSSKVQHVRDSERKISKDLIERVDFISHISQNRLKSCR